MPAFFIAFVNNKAERYFYPSSQIGRNGNRRSFL